MDFDEYQSAIVATADPADMRHEQIPLLGLGAHVGALLGAQQMYLRDALATGASKALVSRELGEVIRSCALAASMLKLSLGDVALDNLRKIDGRARALKLKPLPAMPGSAPGIDEYQDLASITDQLVRDGIDPLSLGVPILGLAGEAGSLLVELKKRYRGDSAIPEWPSFVGVELGDILWYSAAVATHAQLRLEDVAKEDAGRAEASQVSLSMAEDCQVGLPILDADFPDIERFPRYMVFRFNEAAATAPPTANMTLIEAAPYVFVDGPIANYLGHKKDQGFTPGERIGDPVDDNSRRSDGYRYHDAIHLGFLAVMGWSPNIRSLLGLKRRSIDEFDRNEDGARAIFAEEGIAAVIAKQAHAALGFDSPRLVSEDLVGFIATVLEDLEVSKMPPWLWRRAISQGWRVLKRLEAERGGYVTLDLDLRLLEYSKLPPSRHAGERVVASPGTGVPK